MFHKLSTILPKTLAKNKIASQIEATLILEKTNKYIAEIIGQELKNQAKAVFIKDGIIAINVGSSQIMSELRMYEHAIVERLHEQFPKVTIKGLRLSVTG